MLFNCELPINNLSFGHISFGILNEFYKRGLSPNLFPIGQPDLGVYDKVGPDFHQYIGNCIQKGIRNFKKNMPFLKLWHCNLQSALKVSEPSFLLVFHELDSITDEERNILNSYNGIFVTSTFSKKVFENNGVTTPIHYIKLGFDNLHYYKTDKKYYDDGSITWALYGKMEVLRKAHEKVIKLWCKKYANDKKHRLHLFLNNPFMKPEDLNAIYARIFDGQKPFFNTILYGFQATDSLMNECYNAADIVIDMSRGESLSLPSMISTGIGKHAILHRATALADWGNDENAVMINSSSKIIAEDNIFFRRGDIVNQGNLFDWNEQDFLDGCDKIVERFNKNPINEAGFKIKEEYSFKNGVDNILKIMEIN